MFPSVVANMIPQKRFIGSVQGIAPNTAGLQTVTFQVTAAYNYLDLPLVLGGAVTAAMIQQLRLKIGANVIQKWRGVDLDARLQYDRVPASSVNNVLLIPLRRLGIRGGLNILNFDQKVFLSGSARDLAYESSLNCGSAGGGFAKISDVTIELDLINTPATPNIKVYGRVTAPVEGGPGAVYRVDQQTKTISNGSVVITKSEMGLDALRPFITRITLVNNVNADSSVAVFDNFQLRYGTNDWWTIGLGLFKQFATMDALRTLQAGYTILDFQEEGFGDEMLDMSASNSDILLQFDASGITDGLTLTYYVETLGLPFSRNNG